MLWFVFLGFEVSLSPMNFCGVLNLYFWQRHHWDLSNCLYQKKAYWNYFLNFTRFMNGTFEYADNDWGSVGPLFLLDLSLIFAYKWQRNHWYDLSVLLLDRCLGLKVLTIHHHCRRNPITNSLILLKKGFTIREWGELSIEFR
jgi:hypothetical protein